MSESPSTEATEPVQQQGQQGEPADLGDNGKKALEAERRARTAAERQAKALESRLAEFEAAKLSDLERAQKEAQTAQAELAEYRLTTMRQKVALEKGVPAALVDRLRGADEAELTADADELLALLAPKETEPQGRTAPRPDPSQGSRDHMPLNGDPLLSAVKEKLGIA